jgi:hypothetical protein
MSPRPAELLTLRQKILIGSPGALTPLAGAAVAADFTDSVSRPVACLVLADPDETAACPGSNP